MKKIMLILTILLLTGCSANYTITIDEDMKVTESLTATESDEFFEAYPNSSHHRVISFILQPNLEYLNGNDYSSQIINNGVKLEKNFYNIDEYLNVSEIYKQATNNIEYYEEGSKVHFKTIISINTDEQDQTKYYVENLKLNIQLPFNVISSNADSVDEKNGIYTWNFDKTNNNIDIELVFDKDAIKRDYTMIIVIGILGLILLIVGGFIASKITKNKSVNEI